MSGGQEGVVFVEVPRGGELPGGLRRRVDMMEYLDAVRPIVEDVRERGYEAVREYSLRFDGVELDDPRLGPGEMREAFEGLGEKLRWALRVAAGALRRFHESTRPPEIKTLYL
jgi:histidinol dehydrogenase